MNALDLIEKKERLQDEEEKDSICNLLTKVRGDLQQLRNELQNSIAKGNDVNVHALQETITQIENHITNRTRHIVKTRHRRFKTLPIVKPPDLYKSLCGVTSPGQDAQLQYVRKLLAQPFHPSTRHILNDAFGIPYMASNIVEKSPRKEKQHVILGSTIQHQSISPLPLINRREGGSTIPPSPISAKDTQHGLLNLVERGLIPKAADIVLEPSPVQQKSLQLHTFTKRDFKVFPCDNLEGGGRLVGVKLDLANYTSVPSLPPIPSTNQLTAITTTTTTTDATTDATADATGGGPTSIVTVKLLHVPTDKEQLPPVKEDDKPLPIKKLPESKISVRSGVIMDDYPEYEMFKVENQDRWKMIQRVIECIERLAQDYAIPVIYISTNKLVELAVDYELELLPKYKDLLYCIINSREIKYFLTLPGRRYKGIGGRQAAAAKIQATYRMYKGRCSYLFYRKMKWAAGVIAMGWILYMRAVTVRRNLKDVRIRHVISYRKKLKEFDWNAFFDQKRVIVHIPSLGYSAHTREELPKFSIMQNRQMSRICDISDPNVEVIYVSPIDITDELKDYYQQLFISANYQDAWNRIHFIVPDNLNSFGRHKMPLSSLLKYSPLAIKQIKSIIGPRPAAIIPHLPSPDDMYIANVLDVPLIGGEPDLIYLYSSYSGRHALFEDASISTPPHITNIYSQEQLMEMLASLIVNNLNIKRWLFKIENCPQGNGIGYCDITDHLNCYKWMVKESQRYGDKWNKKWAQHHAMHKVMFELPTILSLYGVPGSSYSLWPPFYKEFIASGGSVEAYPPSDSVTSLSTDILLKSNNSYTLLSTWDHIHSHPFRVWGGSVPQTSVDSDKLTELVDRIAKGALSRGLIGHITIDYVTFINPIDMSQVLWAVDIDFGPSDVIYMSNLMSMLSGPVSPQWPVKQSGLYAVVSTQLNHSNLSLIEYGVFFQMCKAHLIGFNNKTSIGTVFTLIESQQRQHLGIICIQHTLKEALSSTSNTLSIIHQEICTSQMQGKSNFPAASQALNDIITQLEVTTQHQVLEVKK